MAGGGSSINALELSPKGEDASAEAIPRSAAAPLAILSPFVASLPRGGRTGDGDSAVLLVPPFPPPPPPPPPAFFEAASGVRGVRTGDPAVFLALDVESVLLDLLVADDADEMEEDDPDDSIDARARVFARMSAGVVAALAVDPPVFSGEPRSTVSPSLSSLPAHGAVRGVRAVRE